MPDPPPKTKTKQNQHPGRGGERPHIVRSVPLGETSLASFKPQSAGLGRSLRPGKKKKSRAWDLVRLPTRDGAHTDMSSRWDPVSDSLPVLDQDEGEHHRASMAQRSARRSRL